MIARPSTGASSLFDPKRRLAPLASNRPAITSGGVEHVAPHASDLARAQRVRLDQRPAPVPALLLGRARAVTEEMGVHVGQRRARSTARQGADPIVQLIE